MKTVGSFANALAWRLQRGKDYVRARSVCEHCAHQLSAADLVPVFSWTWLRGRCRYCGEPISIRHPLIEFATGAVFYLLARRFGYYSAAEVINLAFWLGSSVFLVALFVYDLDKKMLPNKLVYPLIVLGVVRAAAQSIVAGDIGPIIEAAIGLAAVGGLFYLIFQLSGGKWLGGGDVKLAAFIGLALGWLYGLMAIMLASWFGLVVYLIMALRDRTKLRHPIPFGPLLIVAAYTAVLWGDQLVSSYLKLVLVP